MTANDMLLSFNQLTARDLPFPTSARAARECGFRGYGVLPSTLAALGVDAVRSVLDGEGLTPTSVCAFIGLVGPTSGARAERLVAARRCLEYAAGLDAPLVVVVGGPTGGLNARDAWEQAAGALDMLLDAAAATGARILVEPLHPALISQSVVTSVADALDLASTSDATGVVVDTWHVWWDSRLQDGLRDAAHRVGIVHLSDWADAAAGDLDRALPGDGIADLPGMCADLLRVGFAGWWELEVLSERLWAGDQVALVRASYEAAVAVLDKAQALADGPGDEREATR